MMTNHAPALCRKAVLAMATFALAACSEPGVAQPDPGPAAADVLQACRVDNWPGQALCGSFTVHEDRAAGAGRTIDLNILVLPAREPSERDSDPVLFFSGGPGQASTDGLTFWAGALPELSRTRDFVAVDQRGTGRSGALACKGPLPSGSASLFGTLFPTDHVDACRAELERDADLTLYSTPHAADDIADVMRELGYSTVNVLGGSYGTRLGLVFLRRHPDLVRTLIVNGVAPPHLSAYLRGPPLVQQGMEREFEACAADPVCHAAHPDPAGDVASLMDRLAGPVPVQVTLDGHASETVMFHRGDLAYAIRGLLYSRAAEDIAPWARQAVATGGWSSFPTYYFQRASWVVGNYPTGLHLSIVCAEEIMRFTPAEAAAATEGTLVGSAVYDRYRSACERWPLAPMPPGYHDPVTVDRPVLLVSGGRDPATPQDFAESTAAHLPDGHHLLVPEGHHVPRNPCVMDVKTRFILRGHTGGLPATCSGS